MDFAADGIFIFGPRSLMAGRGRRRAQDGADCFVSTPAPVENVARRREPSVQNPLKRAIGRPICMGREHAAGRVLSGNGGMFEKRPEVICCFVTAGAGRLGLAAKRPALPHNDISLHCGVVDAGERIPRFPRSEPVVRIGVVARRGQRLLALTVTGGDLVSSPWIELETLFDRRTRRACPRRSICSRGTLWGLAQDAECAVRRGKIAAHRDKCTKTSNCAGFEAVQAWLPRPRFARDNCSYREQNRQFTFSCPHAGPPPTTHGTRRQPSLHR